jgi:endonuclease-8
MPEGDTLYRTAQRLHQALAGQRIVRFTARYAQLAAIDDQTPLAGRTVRAVRALGKHLLIELSDDLTLHTHLRMQGSWHLYRPGERWQRPESAMRLLLATDSFLAVGFDVPVAELLTAHQLRRHPQLAALGPDLLAPEASFDAAEALRRLAAQCERAIGEALLDQRVMAGVGNELESEILFAARIDPFRATATLAESDLANLIALARRLLIANVVGHPDGGVGAGNAGPRRTASSLDPRVRQWVYGRSGAPCRRCGTTILYRRQGEDLRGTYWCPACQC